MVVVAFSESDTTATMVLPRNNNGSRLGSLFSLILMVNYLWVPSSVATATAVQSFDDMMVVSNVPLESQPEEDQRQQRYLRHRGKRRSKGEQHHEKNESKKKKKKSKKNKSSKKGVAKSASAGVVDGRDDLNSPSALLDSEANEDSERDTLQITSSIRSNEFVFEDEDYFDEEEDESESDDEADNKGFPSSGTGQLNLPEDLGQQNDFGVRTIEQREKLRKCIRWAVGLEHESMLVHRNPHTLEEYAVVADKVLTYMARYGPIHGLDPLEHSIVVKAKDDGAGKLIGKY